VSGPAVGEVPSVLDPAIVAALSGASASGVIVAPTGSVCGSWSGPSKAHEYPVCSQSLGMSTPWRRLDSLVSIGLSPVGHWYSSESRLIALAGIADWVKAPRPSDDLSLKQRFGVRRHCDERGTVWSVPFNSSSGGVRRAPCAKFRSGRLARGADGGRSRDQRSSDLTVSQRRSMSSRCSGAGTLPAAPRQTSTRMKRRSKR